MLVLKFTVCRMLISFMVVVNLCIRFDDVNFMVRTMSYVDVIYGCHVHDIRYMLTLWFILCRMLMSFMVVMNLCMLFDRCHLLMSFMIVVNLCILFSKY